MQFPIIPDNPADLPRFLRDYLGEMHGEYLARMQGQEYQHSKESAKAQYWDDYVSSFNAGKAVGPNAPTFAAMLGSINAYQFSATTMNELLLAPIHITHTYKPGTPIFPHVHWCSPGTNTGVVRWGLEYTLAKGHGQASGSVFPAPTTIYLEQSASGTAYKHQIIETLAAAAISSANIEPDTLILMRVFRDAAHANDTCTDAVFGLMCDMHYQRSYWATKNKAPDFYR